MTGIYAFKLKGEIVYVGQSLDIKDRYRRHLSEARNPNDNSYQTLIHRAFRKYGIEEFELIVLESTPKRSLNKQEKLFIKEYKPRYNMTEGGEGGIPTKEVRKKMSLSAKGNTSHLGFKHSIESKKLIGLANLGKKRSQKIKNKISISLLGNKRALGHKHTKEWKENMSQIQKGHIAYNLGMKMHSKKWKQQLKIKAQNSIRNERGQFICQS